MKIMTWWPTVSFARMTLLIDPVQVCREALAPTEKPAPDGEGRKMKKRPTDTMRLDWLTGQEQINFHGTWPKGSNGEVKRIKQIIWWKFKNTEDFHCENRKSFRQAIDAAMSYPSGGGE